MDETFFIGTTTEKVDKTADENATTFLSILHPSKLNANVYFTDSLILSDISATTANPEKKGLYKVTIRESDYKSQPAYFVEFVNTVDGTEARGYVTSKLVTLYQEIIHKEIKTEYILNKEGTKIAVVKNSNVKCFELNNGYLSKIAEIVYLRLLAVLGEKCRFGSSVFYTFHDGKVEEVKIEVQNNVQWKENKTMRFMKRINGRITMVGQLLANGQMVEVELPELRLNGQASDYLRGAPVTDKLKLKNFDNDMELLSREIQLKGEVMDKKRDYVKKHPELNHMMADFMKAVLTEKPTDIYEFASGYFG